MLKKVLILGAGGQLGRCLQDAKPKDGVESEFIESSRLDITDFKLVRDYLGQARPDCLINAAAYTAVDRAESEPKIAAKVNADSVANLARVSEQLGANLIHISTDFVFDGESSTPYGPESQTHPLSIYGATKLAGELALRSFNPSGLIIRTSWLYSEYGNNFAKTMLRLFRERDEVRVVNDQVGSPTYALGLARVIWQIIAQGTLAPGIFHWSDEGGISWFEFAQGIRDESLAQGLVEKPVTITPIPSSEYPTPARRPAYSVLDTSSLHEVMSVRTWQEMLKLMLANLKNRELKESAEQVSEVVPD